MATEDGQGHLVFNGEIYNHVELRRDLGDVAFRGHSDSETLLQYFSRFGSNGLPKLNGIFGFAFLDKESGRLFLVRDPYGVKPLYYAIDGSSLAFSSEVKPLLQLVGACIDRQQLAEVLAVRYAPAPATPWDRIYKVRPGHYVEVDLGGDRLSWRERSYLDSWPGYEAGMDDLTALDAYESAFSRAVEQQMMADVDVGVLLSGGVDSALVAHYAQAASDKPLKAFTVGFEGRSSVDEIEDARETAEWLGMEHHVVRIGADGFFDLLRRCVSVVEEPLATTSIVPMFYLSELAARRVKVVLTGQGADEPLGGYGRYQGELWNRYVPRGLAKVAAWTYRSVGGKREQLQRSLDAWSSNGDIERFMSSYSVFCTPDVEGLIGEKIRGLSDRFRYYYDLLGCQRRKHTVERMMAIDLRMNLADDLLLYTDKVTMHHSLECRVPILDIDLVNLIERLDVRKRVRFGSGKVIHKRLAMKILPQRFVKRKKKGFLSPTEDWFRRGGRLREILLEPGTRFSDFVSLSAVEAVIREHEAGFNRERQLFLLLALHAWLEEYA